MRKINSTFIAKFISEAGAQLQNKDYFAFVELDRYAIYVIADGLDEAVDQNSAKLAVSHIISDFTDNPNMRKGTLKRLIRRAHRELVLESTDFKLKTALTVVVTDYVKVRYAMAGNTRFALYRDGFFKHKSKDQSLTRQLVDEEQVTLDKAMQHEERNNLYCYLGQEGRISPYVSRKMKLKDGDIIMLLTKGVWEHIDIMEIGDGLSEAKEAGEVLDNIEELLLSKQPDELNNYTAAVLFVDKIFKDPKKKARIKKLLAIGIPILIIITVLSIVLWIKHKRRVSDIEEMNTFKISAEEYIDVDNFERAKEEYNEALKIAKKLKLKKETGNFDKCFRLCELVGTGDESFTALSFKEALKTYEDAQNYGLKVDSLGKDQIDEKIELVKDYMSVDDLIKDGDQAKDISDVDEAIIDYRNAKRKANDLGYLDGKDEAENKLDDLMNAIQDEIDKNKEAKEKEETEKKAEEAAAKEEEKAKEEADEKEEKEKEEADEKAQKAQEEAAQKKKEDNASAAGYMQSGNAAYQTGNFEDAKMYYLMASDLFSELDNKKMTDQIQEKVQLCEKKAVEAANRKNEADGYVLAANNKYNSGELEDAKLLYLMALDIYQDMGLADKVTSTAKKIEMLEQLMTKKNQ